MSPRSRKAALSRFGLFVLPSLLFSTACHGHHARRGPSPTSDAPGARSIRPITSSSADRAVAARSMNAFAAALCQKLRSHQGNLLWSPASLSLALTMAYAGARGPTRAQMRSALDYRLDDTRLHRAYGDLLTRWNAPNKAFQLDVASRVYADRSAKLLGTYVALTRDRYGAPVETLDLKGEPSRSANRINGWVSNRTHGTISHLIDASSLTPDPLLVLVNAVYFKGKWETPFERSATENHAFTLADRSQVQTPMMNVQHEFAYAKLDDGTKLLEMSYKGGQLEMLVALPAQPDGLPALERSIHENTVTAWVQRTQDAQVDVHLPRFRLEPQSLELTSELRAMGMPLALSDAADFSGIGSGQKMEIGAVVQRSLVAVDEQGTVAAAATGLVAQAAAAPPPAKDFNADHPFLFFIRDTVSGAILFWGRLENPTRQS